MHRTRIPWRHRWRSWLLLGAAAGSLSLHLFLLPHFLRHRGTIEFEPGLWRALSSLEGLALLAGALCGLALSIVTPLRAALSRAMSMAALLSFLLLCGVPASERAEFAIWDELETPPPDRPMPNFVLLVSDSLRGDVFDDLDSSRVRFPRLSHLRAQSLDYRQMHAASSWTPPSMAGLLTGRMPSRLGSHQGALPDSAISFVELLRDAGYETVAISDNHLTHPRYGFAQGFTRYWQRNNCIPFAESALSHWRLARLYEHWIRWCGLQYRGADRIERAFWSWDSRRDRRRPFFLLIHYMDTHYPYYAYPDRPRNLSNRAARESFREYSQVQLSERDLPRAPFARASISPQQHENLWLRYLGAAQVVDESVGGLLRWLDRERLSDSTLVVFTADHGEEFHEHGTLAHGRALYEESIRVPCFLRPLPSTVPAAVVDLPTSQCALANTLLGAAGLALRPELPDPLPTAPSRLGEAVFSELDRSGTQILAGRFGDLKLLHASARNQRTRSELYHLDVDADETVDRHDEIDALPSAMLARFHGAWVQLVEASPLSRDPDREETLRGLGYLR